MLRAITFLAGPVRALVPSYDALVELYEATNGAAWLDNEGWMDMSNRCSEWSGVQCSGSGDGEYVRSLQLDKNGLEGIHPPTGTPHPASLT